MKGVEPGSSHRRSRSYARALLPIRQAARGRLTLIRKERVMASSTPQSPDPSPAQAMLSPEEVVQHLRALREQIPLPEPLPNVPASRRRRLAHVDPQFVVAAINASGASPTVQTALGRTDEELRQETGDSQRWTAAIDEVRALLQSLHRREHRAPPAHRSRGAADVPDLPAARARQRSRRATRDTHRRDAEAEQVRPRAPQGAAAGPAAAAALAGHVNPK